MYTLAHFMTTNTHASCKCPSQLAKLLSHEISSTGPAHLLNQGGWPGWLEEQAFPHLLEGVSPCVTNKQNTPLSQAIPSMMA
jgi:hypothetical protein